MRTVDPPSSSTESSAVKLLEGPRRSSPSEVISSTNLFSSYSHLRPQVVGRARSLLDVASMGSRRRRMPHHQDQSMRGPPSPRVMDPRPLPISSSVSPSHQLWDGNTCTNAEDLQLGNGWETLPHSTGTRTAGTKQAIEFSPGSDPTRAFDLRGPEYDPMSRLQSNTLLLIVGGSQSKRLLGFDSTEESTIRASHRTNRSTSKAVLGQVVAKLRDLGIVGATRHWVNLCEGTAGSSWGVLLLHNLPIFLKPTNCCGGLCLRSWQSWSPPQSGLAALQQDPRCPAMTPGSGGYSCTK